MKIVIINIKLLLTQKSLDFLLLLCWVFLFLFVYHKYDSIKIYSLPSDFVLQVKFRKTHLFKFPHSAKYSFPYRLLSVFCRSPVCLSHFSALSKPSKLAS